VPIILVNDYTDHAIAKMRPLIAVTLILFNLKLVYFLRIFPATAPIIRIIVDVSADIKWYIVVLFVCIFGI
jgi:hypothetical protein